MSTKFPKVKITVNCNSGNIGAYCLVAIMKKLIQLMLHFHWVRSPCRRADIVQYSLSS